MVIARLAFFNMIVKIKWPDILTAMRALIAARQAMFHAGKTMAIAMANLKIRTAITYHAKLLSRVRILPGKPEHV